MDSTIYGSPRRDRFKQRHKLLSKEFYACDLDFVLIQKTPVPDIVAVLDYKANEGERITFAEVIAYCAMIRRGIPVYVIRGNVDTGAFDIEQFVGGHHREPRAEFKHITRVLNWEQFGDWERRLRDAAEATWEP
jgi:hypothetical protein